MYAACLFCNGALGSNETIERFPVGGRLAFDTEKGRLWVVCSHCGRWNLTPLEERWEAVEQCEREFRSSHIRASTPNIGLSRLASGLVLIRIGRPPGPEMATWRYSASFARRSWRASAGLAVAGGAFGAAMALTGGLVFPIFILGGGALARRAVSFATGLRTAYVVSRGALPEDRFSVSNVRNARLLPGTDSGWSLRIDPTVGPTREFTGDAATNILRKTLPYVNGIGATRANVATAIERITAYASPEDYVRLIAKRAKRGTRYNPDRLVTRGTVAWLPPVDRLALEMAVNNETERRALEGDLAPLEAAWREAEEVAAIADNLFLPESVQMRWRQLTRRR